MKSRNRYIISLLFFSFSLIYGQQNGFWGDQGDGTFRNPIIPSDYSDPDPIRVGEDYYMAVSTFESFPGLTILESKDLVNWQYSGSVFKNLVNVDPAFSFKQMDRYGEGIFAPTIRYHDNKFWVFVNFYTDGFFVATAEHPSGQWTIRRIKDKHGNPLKTRYWTDPCPFWDDDGKAYLTASRPGDEWFGYIFEMTPDGGQLLDADVDHMNELDIVYRYPDGGTLYSPFQSTEGNKIYKRNGFYYIVHIEFLPDGQGCGTYIMRSTNIYGIKKDGSAGKPGDPGKYEIYKIGHDGCEGIDQQYPGQGGFVTTPEDDWFWIGQFNSLATTGMRSPHLVPVTWIDDWPVFGVSDENGKRDMTWQMKKPISGYSSLPLWINDEFDGPDLNPNWLWNHQSDSSKWSLSEKPGYLRIKVQNNPENDFFKIPNVINVRHFRSESEEITTRLDLKGLSDKMESGLAIFNGGVDYARIGVKQKKMYKELIFEVDEKVTKTVSLPEISEIYLRVITGYDEEAAWYYSLDGKEFKKIEYTYQLKAGNFRGSMIGLYTFTRGNESGYLDIDWFRTEIKNRPE